MSGFSSSSSSSSPPVPRIVPVHDYSMLRPELPIITVPPGPNGHSITLPGYDGITAERTNDADLRIITGGDHVVATPPLPGWTYALRRQAQLILPFLYLGPSTAARDLDFLRKEKISLLLVVRDTQSARARLLNADRIAAELNIESAAIDVEGHQQLIAAFPRAKEMVNEHLLRIYHQESRKHEEGVSTDAYKASAEARKGKVLVYCETGNERSAAVVVAYLLSMYNVDLVRAIQFVQQQRFCVALDDSLKHLLLSYEGICKAQQLIDKATGTPSGRSFQVSTKQKAVLKRDRDEIDDMDTEMREADLDDDEERFANRRNMAPFVASEDTSLV